jgi:serine/threonine protein kinase
MATCPKCGEHFGPTVRLCPKDGSVLDSDPAPDPRIGQVLDGKYRLDAFLSEGGMGAVYRATHIMLSRVVAVKLIKPELVTSPDLVRRFQREAQAASNLNHPNIVGVFDLGQTADGTLYIAMEFIDGPSLKDVIRQSGPMAPSRVVAILRQVASALSLAHKHNIIHRDLKPHNVMLATDKERREIAKLLDFGIAKTFDDAATQLTVTGFALGTPQYMAPEQAAGKVVDGRTDLYSLGIILYEMLAGEVPFSDPSTAAILVKQMTEVPEPPSTRNPKASIPPSLEGIALKCLEKDPAKRFQTADEFCAALDSAQVEPGALASGAPTLLLGQTSSTAPTVAIPAATIARSQALTGIPAQSVSSQAVTLPAAAARAAVAATSEAPPAGPVAQPSEGTRPTVPAIQPPAAAAATVQGSKTGGSNSGWVVAAAVVLFVLGVGASIQFGYLQLPGGWLSSPRSAPASPASAASAPPQASPASAMQAATPINPTASTPSNPAASAPSNPPASAPDGSTAVTPSAAPASPQVSTPPPAQSKPTQVAAAPARQSAPAREDPSRKAAAPDRSTNLATASTASGRADPRAATANSSIPSGAPATARANSPATAPANNPSSGQEPARVAQSEPDNPAILFQCSGAPMVCGAVRSAVSDALERNNMTAVRNPARALLIVTAMASVVQERVNNDFGTPLATRTFSVDLSAETRDGEVVGMPPSRTFSYDAQYGKDRLDENARLIAGEVVERVRAFAKKRAR